MLIFYDFIESIQTYDVHAVHRNLVHCSAIWGILCLY